MPPVPRSRRLRAAMPCLAAALLVGQLWPIWGRALAGSEPRGAEAAPLASVPACEGRLRLETLPGEGVLDPPRLRLYNPGPEAMAWRLTGVPRMEVVRGGESVWLAPGTRPEAVICR